LSAHVRSDSIRHLESILEGEVFDMLKAVFVRSQLAQQIAIISAWWVETIELVSGGICTGQGLDSVVLVKHFGYNTEPHPETFPQATLIVDLVAPVHAMLFPAEPAERFGDQKLQVLRRFDAWMVIVDVDGCDVGEVVDDCA
jgi:hypothetical protein